MDPADTDVFKTSSGRLKKVTTSCDQTRRRQDVWKKTRIYDVLKTSDLCRLKDVQFRMSRRRQIYDVYRTFDLRRLEDVQFYDVLKTSDLRHLENV